MGEEGSREGRERMKLIYVCSPCRGNPPYSMSKTEENIRNARFYCKAILVNGYIPIAPHAFYQGLLSDDTPEQRAKAIEIGLSLLRKCDELWVFGKEISEGMKTEIALAEELNIPVLHKD